MPVYPPAEDVLIHEGRFFKAEWYYTTSRGNGPLRSTIKGSRRRKGPGLWPCRFFNFTTAESKVIVTNAYHKQSQKMKKQDLEKLKIAAHYRADYLKRVKENTYYEN